MLLCSLVAHMAEEHEGPEAEHLDSACKVCAEERPCLRGVVTPSLLPPAIILAGWIKSPLESPPKAP